jgi:hypothetical protein
MPEISAGNYLNDIFSFKKCLFFSLKSGIINILLINEETMNSKSIKKLGAISGWIGLILIQSATIPTIINRIFDPTVAMPPLDMVALIWAGLLLFLIRALIQKDMLYIVSNSIGFFFQSVLLYLIVV